MCNETIVSLINKTYTEDEIGQQIAEETKTNVYAELFSISQTEFYNAGKDNMKPSIKCVIWQFEYDSQNEVEIDGKSYGVTRTYIRADEKIELYLEEKVGYDG